MKWNDYFDHQVCTLCERGRVRVPLRRHVESVYDYNYCYNKQYYYYYYYVYNVMLYNVMCIM